jgi:hypothetical protein
MSTQDVFAAPKSTVRDVAGGNGVITDTIVAALRKTRPWVLLLAILGFIGSAFTALASIPMLMGGAMMGNMEGIDAEMAPFGTGMMVGMGALYLISAIIYFIASLYLLRYAGAIKRLVSSLDVVDLEDALQRQASFWKLMGILALVTIVLVIIGLVVGIGGAMFMGASAR